MAYEVTYWGSLVDNDDCITGYDFESEQQARRAFQRDPVWSDGRPIRYCARIKLDGPGCHEQRVNPAWVPTDDDDEDDWRRERAMQAGMAGGCDAYNDAMGWEVEP